MGLSVNGYRVEQYDNMDGNFVESQHVRIQGKKVGFKETAGIFFLSQPFILCELIMVHSPHKLFKLFFSVYFKSPTKHHTNRALCVL